MKATALLLLAGLAAGVAACTPTRTKQEKLEAQFAAGHNWPDAIMTLEQAVGPAQMLGGSCTTDLGTIAFTKLQTGEYLVNYPTRGAGAPGAAMPRSPEGFASAMSDAFSHSRCTRAEFQYDQYAVAVDIASPSITAVRVSRAR